MGLYSRRQYQHLLYATSDAGTHWTKSLDPSSLNGAGPFFDFQMLTGHHGWAGCSDGPILIDAVRRIFHKNKYQAWCCGIMR